MDKIQLLLFVILLVGVLCRNADVKLLFTMNFCLLIHRMLGRSAECYADAVRPK